MNGLKLSAAAICGSALTLALTTLAQAPKPRAAVECADSPRILDGLLMLLHQNDAITRQLARIESAPAGEDVWARDVDSKLDQIENQLMLQTQLRQMR